jgi:hypothetical protein
MKRVLPLLSLLILTAAPVIAKSAQKAAPKPASVICDVTTDEEGESTLTVIAALHGKRWLSSEDAVGLLHEADRLPLCTPQGTPVGQVTLEDRGRLRSEVKDLQPGGEALQFQASVQPSSGSTEATTDRMATRFATWSRGLPPPRWIRWTELPEPAKGSPYWRVAEDWIRSRKLPARALETLRFVQAARADLNGDGKDEVFLSFAGYSSAEGDWDNAKFYSCLLMRRVLPTGKVETVVLDDTSYPNYSAKIAGLCDLDHDGWAEAIVRVHGVDTWSVWLYRWNGRRFATMGAYGFSV